VPTWTVDLETQRQEEFATVARHWRARTYTPVQTPADAQRALNARINRAFDEMRMDVYFHVTNGRATGTGFKKAKPLPLPD